MLAVVVFVRPNGTNPTVGRRQHVLTVDIAPLIAVGWSAQVMVAILNMLAAVPIFLADAVATSPIIVPHIRLVIAAILIVVMVLRK